MVTFPIFEKLGGEARAMDLIEQRMNWRPSPSSLKKWRRQGRISSKVGLELSAQCSLLGIPFDVDDFIAKSTAKEAA
jgi:hypothetical protein